MLLFFFVFLNIWAPGFIGGILSAATGARFTPFLFASVLINAIFILFLFQTGQSNKLTHHARRQSARSLQVIGGIILLIGISVSLFIFNSFPIFVVSILLGMTSIYLGTRQLSRQSEITQSFITSPQVFQSWVGAWERVNPSIDKLLPPARETNQPVSINPDVTAYSFDRLVVCDRADIAHFLIANNFHFENNCAILSITGYPQSILKPQWRCCAVIYN